jgi:hypothetical protein
LAKTEAKLLTCLKGATNISTNARKPVLNWLLYGEDSLIMKIMKYVVVCNRKNTHIVAMLLIMWSLGKGVGGRKISSANLLT